MVVVQLFPGKSITNLCKDKPASAFTDPIFSKKFESIDVKRQIANNGSKKNELSFQCITRLIEFLFSQRGAQHKGMGKVLCIKRHLLNLGVGI